MHRSPVTERDHSTLPRRKTGYRILLDLQETVSGQSRRSARYRRSFTTGSRTGLSTGARPSFKIRKHAGTKCWMPISKEPNKTTWYAFSRRGNLHAFSPRSGTRRRTGGTWNTKNAGSITITSTSTMPIGGGCSSGSVRIFHFQFAFA